MTNESDSEPDVQLPTEDELWTLLNEGSDDSHTSRFAIGRVMDTTPNEDGILRVDVEVLYDSYENRGYVGTPNQMWGIHERYLHAPLPDYDEWDEKFEDCVDTLLDYFSLPEVAKMLDGEPSYMTGGRRGYEAARFVILDSVSKSITEFSVHQGHGPSRYGNALASRVSDLPAWLARDALASERQRWDGGLGFDAEPASYLVEVLLVENEVLDVDNDEEITELVNEYDLAYDEYIEGHFSAHDCPDCGAELIERPGGSHAYIPLDCSSCDSRFEGEMADDGLLIGREVTEENDEI